MPLCIDAQLCLGVIIMNEWHRPHVKELISSHIEDTRRMQLDVGTNRGIVFAAGIKEEAASQWMLFRVQIKGGIVTTAFLRASG